MSTQVHYLSHRTVQCGAHSVTDSSESGSASRVARSFGSDKLYICLSNKCFKVYPAYSLCDRHKTLTGSLDPTYMQLADKPCRSLRVICLHPRPMSLMVPKDWWIYPGHSWFHHCHSTILTRTQGITSILIRRRLLRGARGGYGGRQPDAG